VFDLFQSAAFPDQPIGRTILGTVDSVRGFGPDAIRAYMDRNYVGNRMVIAAAGNVDHDQLVDIANDRFHNLRPGGAPEPEVARYVGGEERLVSDHEQAHIVIGLEGRAYNSDGFYAAQVLASILGGGMSSRLFQEVREKRGLCYSVYAFHWAFADSGVFGVAASTGEDEVTELVPVVLDELRKSTKNITDEEVIRVRSQIRAGLLMSLESPSSRAGQLARQQILWGRPIPLQETVDRINRITTERVKQVASQIFDTDKLSVAGIGPVAKLPDYQTIAARLKN
jgi:predicted Zn-dependent peptidase